jgi:hypothetical protein
VRNVPLRGLAGLSNGALLAAAERAGFAVLITVDQNMPAQQNLRGRGISLIVLRTRTTNLEDLSLLVRQGSSRVSASGTLSVPKPTPPQPPPLHNRSMDRASGILLHPTSLPGPYGSGTAGATKKR